VLQQGLQDTQAHHPPSSYRMVSFVISDSDTGIVPTKLLPSKALHSPVAHHPPARPPAAEACPRKTEGRVSQFGGSEVPPMQPNAFDIQVCDVPVGAENITINGAPAYPEPNNERGRERGGSWLAIRPGPEEGAHSRPVTQHRHLRAWVQPAAAALCPRGACRERGGGQGGGGGGSWQCRMTPDETGHALFDHTDSSILNP
jgi:hypothetical protein